LPLSWPAEPKPVTSFQPLIPPTLVHLIHTCLAKDPDERRQNMHDVLLELRWIAEGGSQAGILQPVVERRKRRERLSWAVAAVASAPALALGFFYFRQTPAPVDPVRFEQPVPPKNTLDWFDAPAAPEDAALGQVVTAPGTCRGSARRFSRSHPEVHVGT
jgi:hypothetical protein